MENSPLEFALQVLTREGIAHAILRNPERALASPQQGDLDLLVSRGDRRRAATLICDALTSTGWVNTRSYLKHHRVLHLDLARSEAATLSVDVLDGIGWGPFSIVSAESVLAARSSLPSGAFLATPLHQATISLMDALLYSGLLKQRYVSLIVSHLRAPFLESIIEKLVGRRASALRDALRAGQSDLTSWRRTARLRLAAYSLLKRATVANCVYFFRVVITRIVRPPGFLIVVDGDDDKVSTWAETSKLAFGTGTGIPQLSFFKAYMVLARAQTLVVPRHAVSTVVRTLLATDEDTVGLSVDDTHRRGST